MAISHDPSAPTTGSSAAVRASFPILLSLLALALPTGCAGLAQRYRPDDVVLARQIARQGADAFHAGQWERAQDLYGKAVEVCPVDERVRARYAETMWQRGLYQEAIQHQQEAVRLSAGDPELMTRLGEMHLARQDLPAASHLAQRVIDSGRESAATYRLLGDVLRQQGKWRDALAAYHRALSLQPEYPEVQLAVAQVYLRHGRSERALATLQTMAASYAPGEQSPDVLYWAGLAAASLGRHSKALTYFAQAETQGLQTADLQYHLAESHHRCGDYAAARVALDRAMHLDPRHPEAVRLSSLILGGNIATLR